MVAAEMMFDVMGFMQQLQVSASHDGSRSRGMDYVVSSVPLGKLINVLTHSSNSIAMKMSVDNKFLFLT